MRKPLGINASFWPQIVFNRGRTLPRFRKSLAMNAPSGHVFLWLTGVRIFQSNKSRLKILDFGNFRPDSVFKRGRSPFSLSTTYKSSAISGHIPATSVYFAQLFAVQRDTTISRGFSPPLLSTTYKSLLTTYVILSTTCTRKRALFGALIGAIYRSPLGRYVPQSPPTAFVMGLAFPFDVVSAVFHLA